MPGRCTRNWWLFPPQTCELQLDEKWAFVFKKRRNCTPEELEQERTGDCWDHVAFYPEHRLVLSVVFGRREQRNIQKLVMRVKKQLQGRVPRLITTDGYAAYAEVFRRAFGRLIKPVHRRGQPNPGGPKRRLPAELTFATVEKLMNNGRVVQVKRELVLGTEENLKLALERSAVSSTINTSFVERHNATDRHRNARKSRRTYRFSKDWDVHAEVGHFVLYSYNFCWCVRTLRRWGAGHWQPCTPAMSAGLTDHVWSIGQWLALPGRINSS
jgi:IS1 family transposase